MSGSGMLPVATAETRGPRASKHFESELVQFSYVVFNRCSGMRRQSDAGKIRLDITYVLE